MPSRTAIGVVLAALVPVVAVVVVARDDGGGPTTDVGAVSPGDTTGTTGGPGSTGSTTVARPAAAPPPTQAQLDSVKLHWEQVATAEYPTVVAFRGKTMYVGEREGRVRPVKDGKALDPPALDWSAEVGTEGEGGLIGMTFSRDGNTLYLHYTDKKADTRVMAFTVKGDAVDVNSKRQLLTLDQPEEVHNGGGMLVDEQGMLWIAFGDGGERNAKRKVAQELDNLFGKLIRIDPRPDGDKPYRIPPDNPFVGRQGVRPEIWAYGLRNPWRFSFDRATGDVWIGDVGEHGAEEIDYIRSGTSGQNFGWPAFEGTKVFTKSLSAPGHVPPLKSIARTGGFCAVTGGYVYRGKALPALVGAYLYTDVCTGVIYLMSQQDGKVVAERKMTKLLDQLVSFAEDADGELYVMSLVGQVWKLVPG